MTALMALPLAASGTGSLLALAGALLLAGMATAPTMVTGMTLVQRLTPEGRLNEGMTLAVTALLGGISSGAAAGGWLVEHAGAGPAYALPAPPQPSRRSPRRPRSAAGGRCEGRGYAEGPAAVSGCRAFGSHGVRGSGAARGLHAVEMAGIEPASNGAEPGLLRVQSAALFSAPEITRTSLRRAQSLWVVPLHPVTGSRGGVP